MIWMIYIVKMWRNVIEAIMKIANSLCDLVLLIQWWPVVRKRCIYFSSNYMNNLYQHNWSFSLLILNNYCANFIHVKNVQSLYRSLNPPWPIRQLTITVTSTKLTLDQWIAGRCGDTTLIILVPGHLDVAFVTPVETPAVIQNWTEFHCGNVIQ